MGAPQSEHTVKPLIQDVHVSLHVGFSGEIQKMTALPNLLVPQADVLWLEHFLIRCLVTEDEIQSMNSLYHCSAR